MKMTKYVWIHFFLFVCERDNKEKHVKSKSTNSGVMFLYMNNTMKIVLHVLQEL